MRSLRSQASCELLCQHAVAFTPSRYAKSKGSSFLCRGFYLDPNRRCILLQNLALHQLWNHSNKGLTLEKITVLCFLSNWDSFVSHTTNMKLIIATLCWITRYILSFLLRFLSLDLLVISIPVHSVKIVLAMIQTSTSLVHRPHTTSAQVEA